MKNIDNKKNFLIITWNKYPEGDAGAIRQHAFANNILDIGYEPIIIGMGETTGFKRKKHEGISYYSLRYKKKYLIYRILGRVLFSYNLRKILKEYNSESIVGILIVSGDMKTFKLVKGYAQKHKIPLYHDSVEWYSECEFRKGKRAPEYIHNCWINEKHIDNSYRVFAISKYLENYFSSKAIRTVRIPVIMDMEKFPKPNERDGKVIRFLYAGSMGGKDSIIEFISAIELLRPDEREYVRFTIAGVTQEQYQSVYGNLNETIKGTVSFVGRKTRDEVLDILRDSDFTVLLRPANERYAKAGFPTKVVESLAMGIPIVCNLTSDLGMYLKDSYNSILVDEPTNKQCLDAIRRILLLNNHDLNKLRIAARKTATECFDRRKYLEVFNKLIEIE